MDEEIERMVVRVRADTRSFAADVRQMQATLDGPLVGGADRAGRAIEAGLLRAVRTGKFGFDDLRASAIRVLDDIAAAALRGGIGAVASGGGLGAGLLGTLAGLLGAPGRATGGPVSPRRPYLVGERGPELFVPTTSGTVMPNEAMAASRDVRVAITINAPSDTAPRALQQSSRQIARAVRAAIAEV